MANRADKVRTAINWDKGVEQFGGDEEMFTNMVGRFESLTFNEGLRKLYEAVVAKNWEEVRHQGHTLKGASAYLAATGVQELSLQIQLRCDKYPPANPKHEGEPISSDPVKAEQQRTQFEQDIVELFLSLLTESKYLKERISEVTREPYDPSQIEIYEKSVRSLYKPQPAPEHCGCCKIF